MRETTRVGDVTRRGTPFRRDTGVGVGMTETSRRWGRVVRVWVGEGVEVPIERTLFSVPITGRPSDSGVGRAVHRARTVHTRPTHVGRDVPTADIVYQSKIGT